MRALLLTEPDEMAWDEYATKAQVWFCLLNVTAD